MLYYKKKLSLLVQFHVQIIDFYQRVTELVSVKFC